MYLGKWSHYKLMMFLKDTTNPRISDGNISDEEDTLQECPDTDGDHDNDIDHIDNDDSNTMNIFNVSETETETRQRIECIPTFESCSTPSISMSTTNLSSNSDHTQPRKKKKNEDKYLEDLLNIESQKVAFLKQSYNNNVTTSEIDEDMSFFQSLIPYFKKLDPIQKLRVRNKFQNILIEELSPIREQALNVSNIPPYIAESTPDPQLSVSSYNAQQYTSQEPGYHYIHSSNVQ